MTILNTISLDTSGADHDGRALKAEMDCKLAGMGDPLDILCHLETIAERRLQYTRDVVTDDHQYISAFINRNI